MPSNPYIDILYPLQDRVLETLAVIPDFPFYLTRGTALNRFYCHTRYSDDLDLFSLQELPEFRARVQNLIQTLNKAGFDITAETLSGQFCRMFLRTPHTTLKIDMVNDPVYHHGNPTAFPLFPRVDNTMNILSNMIAALDRHEAKDIVDIWPLARSLPFCWREIIDIAGKKAPVDPADAAQTIASMPIEELDTIKWTGSTDTAKIFQDIQIISRDILLGKINTLCTPPA